MIDNKIEWNNNTTWYQNIYSTESNKIKLYYTQKAGPIFIYGNDYYIANCLKKGRVWEEYVINRMIKFISGSRNVLDIGAHVGTHSLCYSNLISGNVYAFEAQDRIFSILEKNVKYQNKKNIIIYHNAIGHLNNYEVSIYDKSIDGMVLKNGLQYDINDKINYGGVQLGEGNEKVIMRTIDSYNFQDIDYIKIDIEGCEELAIYGSLESIKRCRPVIVFEYRSDKRITESMKKMMPISNDIINFKTIHKIEKELEYKFIHDIKKYGNDSLLIPNEKLEEINK